LLQELFTVLNRGRNIREVSDYTQNISQLEEYR
jgi:hypothetical protein